ncbi:GrpB family protein [Fusobacteria bacterium ZRK30]|nr:GrpB family protein [Fusobacteria bacterium ZRK30]
MKKEKIDITGNIIIEEYNSKWKDDFKLICDVIFEKVKEHILSIEHVGSTSVEGLCAKPIIDIDIIVKDQKNKNIVIKLLEELGYRHMGDLGIVDREAFFRYACDIPFNDKEIKIFPVHNLYLCIEGIPSLENHLNFRDYLKTNKKALEEYSKLKKELAKTHLDDIDGYCEAKSDFISDCLSKTSFDNSHLLSIKEQNKNK